MPSPIAERIVTGFLIPAVEVAGNGGDHHACWKRVNQAAGAIAGFSVAQEADGDLVGVAQRVMGEVITLFLERMGGEANASRTVKAIAGENGIQVRLVECLKSIMF